MSQRIIAQIAHHEQAASDTTRPLEDRASDLLMAVGLFAYLLKVKGEDIFEVIAAVEALQNDTQPDSDTPIQ